MKIYTKTGDKGTTSLLGGTRVSKADLRLEAYGTLDELSSQLGLVAAQLKPEWFPQVQALQSTLLDFGAHLANDGKNSNIVLPELNRGLIAALEEQIDLWNQSLPPLQNFILPGGSVEAAQCHVARSVCRRGERAVVRLAEEVEVEPFVLELLNRLSDYLFVQARFVLFSQGLQDTPWTKA